MLGTVQTSAEEGHATTRPVVHQRFALTSKQRLELSSLLQELLHLKVVRSKLVDRDLFAPHVQTTQLVKTTELTANLCWGSFVRIFTEGGQSLLTAEVEASSRNCAVADPTLNLARNI